MSPVSAAWTRLSRGLHANDPFAGSPVRNAPYAAVAAGIAIAHLITLWLGYLISAGGVAVTAVFPGAGLDLVIVLLFGFRYWPVLLALYFGVSIVLHVPWLPAIGVAVAGLGRTLSAVALFRWTSGMKKRLGPFDDLAGIAAAGTLGPGPAAVFGTACLVLGRAIPASQWVAALSRWWMADTLGLLTIAPVLIVVARFWTVGRPKHRPWFALQTLLHLGIVSSICYFVFFRPNSSYLLFSVFPLMLLAAAWLGSAAARLTALIIAGAAIWATRTGAGVFSGGTLEENIQNLGLFLAAVSLTGMALGAYRTVGNLALPSGVLLVGWALSGWLYASMDRDRVTYDEARLDRVINSIEARITARFTPYQDGLWGAAGHLAASGRISPKDWHIYVTRLGLLERYPGTTLLSVIQPVPREQAARFTESYRNREWPGFTIRSTSNRESLAEHFVIVCAEPPAVAERAIGADLATDERRRAAAEQARDSGVAVLARNTEMRDGSGKGLQLFVPVYREGAPIATVAERRNALIAWVTVVFSVDAFFRAALSDLRTMISLRAYDGDHASPETLFYASSAAPAAQGAFERTTRLTFGGATWTLGWKRLPTFPFISKTPSAWSAGCTALLSLFLAGLVVTLQTAGRRTADRLNLVQSALALGTWEIDLNARKVRCSGQLLRLYGLDGRVDQLDLNEWLTRVHPDDRERRLAEMGASEQDRDAIERQYRVVWSDGSVHWLHSKALVVFDTQAHATGIIGVDFDITDDKRNEESVRILSSAVEQSPVSITIMDLRGKVQYVNARLTESTGYTLEDLKGRDAAIMMADDTSPELLKTIRESLESGSWKGMLKIKKKNGGFLWAATSILWIRDASGAPTHRLSVAVDMSDRMEMEAALKLSEERFRIAAESSGDSIYEWDLKTDTVAVLGGARIQPLVEGWALPKGKDFRALLYPEDREKIEAAIRRHLDYGEPYSQEYRVIAPNGEVRYYSDTASALRDEQGQPYKWIGVSKDITEQKKVERANAELAKIVECADTAIISRDMAGSVLTWNRGAERMYGYSSAEIIGQNITILFPPDRLEEESEITTKLRGGEIVDHFETVRVTKSGRPINVLLNVSPIRDHSGKLIGAAHVAWDITQIKQLQSQLAHAQKLESVGQLAAGVAHEINTPIQYIGDNGKFLEDAFRDLIKFADAHARPALSLPEGASRALPAGGADALEDGVLEYLRQEIPKSISQLLEGVDNVARIVRAMKEFSHPGPVEKAAVNINRAIESTILVSRNEWKYVTDVTTDFAPDLPPVPCIPGEFNQVILNLIVNAAHAIADAVSGSGGKGTIHISTRQKGSSVEVRVSDTGIGIPKAIQSKVFDPFFTTKPVGKGTGQGLAIAHAVIVQKHGGKLELESEPGRGTTFIIQLPLERELEPA